MTDWVAVSVDMVLDPKIRAFGKEIGASRDAAVARLLELWGQMARHDLEEGNVGDIDDVTLEEWAGWRGKQGRFAQAFRASFTEDGIVNGWWNWNGRHLRKARLERERKRAERTPDNPRTVRGQSDGNTGTGTGTEPTATATNDAAAGAARAFNPLSITIPAARRWFWVPDGKPPRDWSVEREASIHKRLFDLGNTPEAVAAVMEGARLLADRGEIPWLKRGHKLTARLLYNTHSGVLPLWTLAETALHAHQDAPQRAKSRPLSLGDTLMPFGPQEAA